MGIKINEGQRYGSSGWNGTEGGVGGGGGGGGGGGQSVVATYIPFKIPWLFLDFSLIKIKISLTKEMKTFRSSSDFFFHSSSSLIMFPYSYRINVAEIRVNLNDSLFLYFRLIQFSLTFLQKFNFPWLKKKKKIPWVFSDLCQPCKG